MNTNTHLKRTERGQGLVEFAMVLVILLVLLAGTVDLGRAFFTFMAMRDAAQEGATYASISPSDTTNIVKRVRGSSSNPVDMNNTGDIQVQVNLLGAACAGNGVEVIVSYPEFPITMPMLGAVLGAQSLPIEVRVTDTILTPPCK